MKTQAIERMRTTDSTRKPLNQASSLPGEVFHAPEIFAREMERIFSRMWLAVGREEDVARPGDYLTRELGNESILVTRDAEGRVHAFYNLCRHRGARLLDRPEGRDLKLVQCAYHAWSYALDGRLVGAPLMDQAVGFRRDDYPLTPVRLESWEGFLFVNLDEGAAPLARQLEGFPDVSRFQLPRLKRVARVDYDVAANWKLVCENYGECYHCPGVHPQLNRISHFASGGVVVRGPGFTGGPMRLNEGCNTLSLSGTTNRPPIPGLLLEDRQTIHYFNLHPNLFLSLHPDYALTHRLWPEGAGRTRIACEWLFPEESATREDFDPQDAVEFWDLTNRQDWELCERAQKGVVSRGYRPGRYQSGEGCVHAFDNWYLDRMEDGADPTG